MSNGKRLQVCIIDCRIVQTTKFRGCRWRERQSVCTAVRRECTLRNAAGHCARPNDVCGLATSLAKNQRPCVIISSRCFASSPRARSFERPCKGRQRAKERKVGYVYKLGARAQEGAPSTGISFDLAQHAACKGFEKEQCAPSDPECPQWVDRLHACLATTRFCARKTHHGASTTWGRRNIMFWCQRDLDLYNFILVPGTFSHLLSPLSCFDNSVREKKPPTHPWPVKNTSHDGTSACHLIEPHSKQL